MIKNKKLLLSFGLNIVVVLPLASIISCGKSSSNSNYSKSSSKSNNSNSRSDSDSNKTSSTSNDSATNTSDSKADEYSSEKSDVNSKNEPNIKKKTIDNINKNIINKEIARWIKPSDITDEILLNGIFLEDKFAWTLYTRTQYKFSDIKIMMIEELLILAIV